MTNKDFSQLTPEAKAEFFAGLDDAGIDKLTKDQRAAYDSWKFGDAPPPAPEPEPEVVKSDVPTKVGGVESEEEAWEHLKKNGYNIAGVRNILVLQDGNVFYDGDVNNGVNHAAKFGLKSFRLSNNS